MSATNGASLEDCQTNVFVLTELSGLKWKKFVAANDPSRGVSELGSDPILWAYGACLSEGLLAVWRRVPRPNSSLALAADKELWVFWYSQDEPKELHPITTSLTTEDRMASGSWSDPQGLAYDCRTLLFKAIHNLIERNLFTAGYVRLGKWFVQPLDHDSSLTYVDAFNFSFFVHGDTYVCATVNLQRQPPVYKLNKGQLRLIRQPLDGKEARVDVVLAPWSWAASLNLRDALGESNESPSLGGERRSGLSGRQWREWTHFFPLPKPDATENVGWVDPDEKEKQEAAKADALPQMVEVAVGGVRMLYPSSYVLLLRSPVPRKPVRKAGSSPQKRQSSSSSMVAEMMGAAESGRSVGNCPLGGHRLVERAVEELTLSRRNSATELVAPGSQTPNGSTGPPTPSGEDQAQWDLVDPCSKETCACAPTPSAPLPSPKPSPSPSIASKGAQKFGVPVKEERKPGKFTPFHRRSPLTVMEENRAQAALSSIASSQPTSGQPSLSVSPAPLPPKASPAPSIILPNNLPPHEPITQMISPVPSGTGLDHSDSHFSLPMIKTESGASLTSLQPPPPKSLPPQALGKAEAENRRPRPKPSKRLKRPRLAEHDAYLATDAGETLANPNFLYAKDNRVAPWNCLDLDPRPEPALTGLISISDPPHLFPNMPKENIGDGPEDIYTMPDNIMDSNANSNHPPSDLNFDTHLPCISPPPSNEREERKNGVTMSMGMVGPPSVGPYVNIYPTPPTPQVATSPESLHHRLKDQPHRNPEPRPVIAPSILPSTDFVYQPKPLSTYLESGKFAAYDQSLPSAKLALAATAKGLEYSPGMGTQKEERPGELEQRELLQRMEQLREHRAAMLNPILGGPLTPRSQPHRVGTSPYAASQPSPYGVANPRTPLNAISTRMDIHSPLSNASSVPYSRNVASVEGVGASGPEAHGLVAAVLLSDSPINLYRDTNFDACPVCPCGGSLNITGMEVGAYVTPSPSAPRLQSDVPSQCSCGFSAVRYRMLSCLSGLFAEDEYEATATWRCQARRLPPNSLFNDPGVINLLRHQSLSRDLTPQVIYPASVAREADRAIVSAGLAESGRNTTQYILNREEMLAFATGSGEAMDAACLVMDCAAPGRNEVLEWGRKVSERWGLQRAWSEVRPSRSDSGGSLVFESECGEAEAQCTVKGVGRVLVKAMGCIRGLADHVEGPLSWRALVRKAAKEEEPGPEPVPQVLLTADKDLVSLSPLSLRLWDKLLLDPYSSPKDVVYVAVVPENAQIFARSQIFFRELSKVYEGYRFGRHCPFTKALPRDGILAVSPSLMEKMGSKRQQLQKESVPWLDDSEFQHESPENKNRLRAYAQVCQSMLGLLLEADGAFDRNIFRDVGKETGSGSGGGGEPMPPPSAPSEGSEGTPIASSEQCDSDADSGKLPHVVVVYLVNPVLEQESEGRGRLSLLALFRSYLHMVAGLPKNLVPFIQLEIVDLKTVMDCTAGFEREEGKYVDYFQLEGERRMGPGERVWERRGHASTLRNLALSVYTQPRNLSPSCLSSTHAKCLTGLGPTATYLQTVQARLKNDLDNIYRMYSPPYVLPPTRPIRELSIPKAAPDEGAVLYVSYCLSEKQHWLLVTATDHLGSLLESSVINITTMDDRQMARPGDVIRASLTQLWKFIMGVLATGCRPWRLVIGRLGRIGHGELKAWGQLLSKSNLKRTSSLIREGCAMCSSMPAGFHDTPVILSAALVSLESEASLRILPHVFRPDDRFGLGAKFNPLSTPEDASSTHILVFPTSAIAQVLQPAAVGDNDEDLGMDGFGGLDFPDDDIPDGLEDILNDGSGVPPSATGGFRGGFFSDSTTVDISNQPIASGYYISTAPAHGLPNWFWMNNSSVARRRNPVHLRAALHIHAPRVQEEDNFMEPMSAGPKGAKKSEPEQIHPLDSRKPPDVLRNILETYNSLSWLSVDMGTGERKSCLPVHIQALLRLYHATNAVLNQ